MARELEVHWPACDRCRGKGFIARPGEFPIECPHCKGAREDAVKKARVERAKARKRGDS